MIRHSARLVLLSVLLSAVVAGQDGGEWRRVAPAGETFAVEFPTPAAKVWRDVPFGENFTIEQPVYESNAGGASFLVMPFKKEKGGIRPVYLKNLNNFTDGIRYAFKRGSHTLEKVPQAGGRKTHDYLLRVGDRAGSLRILETETHYHVLVALGAGEEAGGRFFNSFDAAAGVTGNDLPEFYANTAGAERVASLAPWPLTKPIDPKKTVISGGVLNGKVLRLPQPDYPSGAKSARVSGSVAVQIVFDEEGKVISAKAVSGHPLLRPSAEDAALKARFAPVKLQGNPIKVSGVLVYNFYL